MKNKEAVAQILNEKLGGFLQESRIQACHSLSLISESVGLPESRILEIEERPAQIPLCELARVIEFYGSERTMEAQLLIMDAGIEARKTDLVQTQRFPFSQVKSWSPVKTLGKAVAFLMGWALWDILKYTFRAVTGGRFG